MVDGGFRGAGSAVVRESALPTDTCLAFVRALDACWDQHTLAVDARRCWSDGDEWPVRSGNESHDGVPVSDVW
jgi:hypothetical protein